MEIIVQVGIVFGICLVGQMISSILPIAVPSSVIGMLLLLLLLCLKIIKPHHIEKKSTFLLQNMAFFFIPAGVGIMANFGSVKAFLLPLLLICLITTVLTFAVTAFTVKFVIKAQNKVRQGRNE